MNMSESEVKSFLLDEVLRDFTNNSKDEGRNELLQSIKNQKSAIPIFYIGSGTCGLGAGAGKTKEAIVQYLEKKKIDYKIIETGCIGFCAVEPIVDVVMPGFNRISFMHVTREKVNDLLDAILTLHLPQNIEVIGQLPLPDGRSWEEVPLLSEHPFFAPQKRLVLTNCGIIDPTSIEEYIARGGYRSLIRVLNTYDPKQVCEYIVDAGLRGRGGGGFPTGKKWLFANSEKAEKKYLICNADEGDPGAFMDRAVIEGDPHRLLEGMAIAAYAIGATTAYIYIRAEYPLAIQRLKLAIQQAENYGLIGKDICGSGNDLELKIKTGAGAFVCGEETALMHSIEGKRGMPRPRPPFPTTQGLFGKPTVINNVETLANVSGIFEKGKSWFNNIGTEKSKGTKVFALSGKIKYTGLVEIPMGTTVRDVVWTIAGGVKDGKKFKAVQIGGPSGGCITEENLDIPIEYESLIKVGAMMGSGGLVVMDEETCMVDIARFFMDFIQRESCGKCIPCREGTKQMLQILNSITERPVANNDALIRFKSILQIEKLARVIKETSLCGLGQSAPNPVLSTLKWFREEYESHIFDRKCPAGQCVNLRVMKIDPDICTGCTLCARKCPTGAIQGAKKAPHYVIEEKCIGCGACIEVCKAEAIHIV